MSRVTLKEVNPEYTKLDHALRENDGYAGAKYDLTLRWLRPYLRPGAKLYNIGVGSGYFNHVAVNAGLTVVGCEPDPDAFTAASITKPALNCELIQSPLADFARGHPPADFIIIHDVLEHIADDAAAVKDLRRLTRSGTRIILSVPSLPALFGQHDVELGHFRRYTKKTLRHVLQPHFHIRRMQYFGMLSIPIVVYFSVFKRSSYPQVAASDNWLSKLYGMICLAESYLSEPLGTSVVAVLEPR